MPQVVVGEGADETVPVATTGWNWMGAPGIITREPAGGPNRVERTGTHGPRHEAVLARSLRVLPSHERRTPVDCCPAMTPPRRRPLWVWQNGTREVAVALGSLPLPR